MQKQCLLLLAATIGLFSCGQNSNKKNGDSSNVATESIALATDPYFSKHLKGTVADAAVTMELLKSGSKEYAGWYSYDKINQPIKIWGSVDSTGNLVLHEDDAGEVPQYFEGKVDDQGTFEGTWHGDNKSFPFRLTVTKEDSTISFAVTVAADSVLLVPGWKEKSPIGRVSATVLWPAAGADAATLNFLRDSITSLDCKQVYTDPAQYAQQYVDSFKASYVMMNDTTGLSSMISEGMGMSYNWDQQTKMLVAWNSYPYLALERFIYAFTGGAHGNHSSRYQMFDLAKKKELEVTDVFKPGFEATLGNALAKAVRTKYKLKDNEPLQSVLFENKIEPNDNFFFTNRGVLFSYAPYEIAAYANGQITLFVPFSEIKDVVNAEYLPK